MAKKYLTQDRLKKNTLADIFVFILEKKQTTRREIEYETGFSWGTVSANVAFLLENGYIKEEKSPHLTPYIKDSITIGKLESRVIDPPSGMCQILIRLSTDASAISTAVTQRRMIFSFLVC